MVIPLNRRVENTPRQTMPKGVVSGVGGGSGEDATDTLSIQELCAPLSAKVEPKTAYYGGHIREKSIRRTLTPEEIDIDGIRKRNRENRRRQRANRKAKGNAGGVP